MEKRIINEDVRNGLSHSKYGTTWLMYLELGRIINFSAFAKEYFERSAQWFQQRVHGYKVHDKRVAFTPDEYTKLAESLRNLADRLNSAADAIEKSSYYDINQ